jgi:O-antigen ligase
MKIKLTVPLLLIMQFTSGEIKLFDLIYLNNIIYIFMAILIVQNNINKINMKLFILFIIIYLYALLPNINYNGLRSISHLYIFLAGPVLAYLYITNQNKLNNFIIFINFGCLIVGIFSLIQVINWISSNGFNYLVDDQFFRISGLSTSPTDLVTQLTVGLALASTFKTNLMRSTARIFYIGLLLFTMSRSAIVVLGIFALIELLHRKSGIFLKLIFLFIIFLAIFISPLWSLIELRIIDIGNSDINIHRILVYQDVFDKSIDNIFNFLFGWGFGSYQFYHPISSEMYDNPHNIFLYILYSSGLVGLMFFVLYIAYLLVVNIKILTRCRDPEISDLLRMIMIIQIVTWTVGMVETNILGIGAGWILGLIFGIPLAINNFYKYES